MLKQKLTSMIRIPVEALGFELIGIELIHSHTLLLRVYIDKKNGVTINDCVDVSNQVSAVLKVEKPLSVFYNLEISSPGFEYPCFTIAHYRRFIGKKINLTLNRVIQKRRKWQGIIKSVHNEVITIIVDGKDQVFEFNDIRKANLIPHF